MTKKEIIGNLESKNYEKINDNEYRKNGVKVELLNYTAMITVGKLVKMRGFNVLERIDF